MLVIRTIKLIVPKVKQPRLLSRVRVGYGSTYCQSKNPAKLIDGKMIEWVEDFTLPIFFNKTLEFEFHPKHEFGYNPEQLKSICTGSLTIADFKKQQMEGDVFNMNNEIVGRFFFEFKVHNFAKASSTASPQGSKKVIVSSILAHFDCDLGESHGYFQFTIGHESVVTPEVPFTVGQLTWTEKLEIPITSEQESSELIIKICVDEEIISESKTTVNHVKGKPAEKYRRIDIFSAENQANIGTLFTEIIYRETKPKSKKNEEKNYSQSTGKLPTLSQKLPADRPRQQHSLSSMRLNTKNSSNGSERSQIIKRKQNFYKNRIMMFKIGESEADNPYIKAKLKQ